MSESALFRPVTITFETLDRLTKEKKPADLIALYMSYVAIVQWQQTTTVKATTDFMAQRLDWGRDKVISTKKKLEKLGLVVSVQKKDAKGKVTGHYVRVMYVITQSVQSSQIPEGGLVHTVAESDTSTVNLQESTNNLQESATPSASVSFGANSNSALPPASTARARALLPQLIEIINPKEKPTADRIRTLNGRLADYTEEEIIQSAIAFSKSEWHIENKQMSVDNLIAPSKFGRWYAKRLENGVPVQKELTQAEKEAKIAAEVIPEAPGWEGADAVK